MPGRIELLAKNTRFQVTVAIVIFIIVMGIIGPYFTMDPDDFTGKKYESPSWNHKLGTDLLGRDVWAQLVHGVRNSLMVGFIAGLLGLVFAFVVGGIGAYKGGWTDEGLNLISNVFLILPLIPILVIISVLFKERSLLLIAFIISIVMWPGAARALRSQVLSLKERGFVDLARISGKGSLRIVFGEIFPNMLAYVFIQFVGMVGSSIVMEAGISLIGLGPSNIATLGSILYWSIIAHAIHLGIWWWFIPPGLVILLFTGSMFMIGSLIDDVLNPKLRGVL
jgi:peptide/nickel transport system permease protein